MSDSREPTSLDHSGETYCGVGSFRPRILQPCKHILSFSLVYGFAGLISQSLNFYINSQVTALEKQFQLDSTTTGIILSCNDIGFLCTVLLVSHFGSSRHIPRILSAACFLFGISGILVSLCQFVDPFYLPQLSDSAVANSSTKVFTAPLCRHGNVSEMEECGADVIQSSLGPRWVVWMLGAGMVLQGIGKSPRTSLSTAYIDNNNPIKTKTGLYLGISTTMIVFGPALATALGGVFRQIPVDLQETSMAPTHPKWIGAWWIGFLLFGCLGVILGLPLLLFPKRLQPSSSTATAEDANNSVIHSIKDLPRSVLRVVRRPVYTLCVTGLMFLIFVVAGTESFSSKYVEKQFMVPGYKTNIILGVQKLVSVTIGTFTGGFLTSRLKLTRLGCSRMILTSVCLSCFFNCLDFFLGCETPHIRGFSSGEEDVVFEDGITACTCDTTNYFPVCGDNITYFSPCFAGCTNQSQSLYGGCSKVTSGQTTAGMCATDCPYLYYYIAVDMAMRLCGTLSIMPMYMLQIRSVDERDKAMAVGLLSFLASLLGFLPAPIIAGNVIDSTCLIWDVTCGVRGSCAQYDLTSLRLRLKALEVSGKVMAITFFLITLLVLRREERNAETYGTKEEKPQNSNNTIQATKF
ncbi:solute carrier organic anion transporter family member 2B1-like [Haliotis rufescens]|uniref:solute carrier organic anion transporter family member 2B1-like n=1 Tax=Haliotis rufescens TaxID=6454 RepID=UPI00201EE995|nr:solute carrier organic anion transporter family member 2B1-like [Haliotis rufescens]